MRQVRATLEAATARGRRIAKATAIRACSRPSSSRHEPSVAASVKTSVSPAPTAINSSARCADAGVTARDSSAGNGGIRLPRSASRGNGQVDGPRGRVARQVHGADADDVFAGLQVGQREREADRAQSASPPSGATVRQSPSSTDASSRQIGLVGVRGLARERRARGLERVDDEAACCPP